MELTAERKEQLLAYCRIDGAELTAAENKLLESFFHAAVSYIGISEPTESGRLAKFDLAVNALVLDSWERRDISITSTVVTANPALRRVINQLKLSEPRPGLNTGGETRDAGTY